MSSSHTLAFLIVLIVFVWKISDSYFRNRKTSRKGENTQAAAQMMAHIDELEERIKVLEQIVTDPKESLSRKIDNL